MTTTLNYESYLSTFGKQIEGSITMEITALANQMKAEGKNVVSMSAGEPDFDTPDYIKQSGIDAIKSGQTKYTAADGMPKLKQAIAARILSDRNIAYSPKEIIVSCGAKHSIYVALMAIINPGDEVIIPAPYWVSYPDQVKMLGGIPKFIETTDKTQFKITAAQLEATITNKTKLLILNSPSNPTGMVYTKEELESIAAVLVKHHILVISDEIYSKLIYEGEHISIASLNEDIKALTIYIDGMSKSYSMTGWRIGYTAAPRAIAEVMSNLQSHSTSNPTTPSQWAALCALENNDDAIEVMKTAFKSRLDYMVDRLNTIPGISCVKPQGAFYAFPNVSGLIGKTGPGGLIKDSVELCKQLLTYECVACVPGSGFGAEGYLRLSYATSMEAITAALDKIENFAKSVR